MTSKIDSMKIPFSLSKRKKLDSDTKKEIRDIYLKGGISQRELARKYSVDKRTIQFCISPEKYEIAKAQRRERWKNGDYIGRYYDKETHRKAMKDLRERKHFAKSVLDGLSIIRQNYSHKI